MALCVASVCVSVVCFALNVDGAAVARFLMALIALRTGLPYRPLDHSPALPDHAWDHQGTLSRNLLRVTLARYPAIILLSVDHCRNAISQNCSAGATFPLRVEESPLHLAASSCCMLHLSRACVIYKKILGKWKCRKNAGQLRKLLDTVSFAQPHGRFDSGTAGP